MAQGVEEVLVAADAAELDLTNAHLQNLDDVPLPESLSVRHFEMSSSDPTHCFPRVRFQRKLLTVLIATQLLDLTANRLTELDSRLLKLPGNQHASKDGYQYLLIHSPKVLLHPWLCPRSEAAAIEAKSPD
jgi:hypothetical protein